MTEIRDFHWTYQEEPHRTRRMQIIKAHPEVTKLVGYEPLTKYVVMGVVALQIALAYLLRHTPFWSWKMWLTAYVVGAVANSNLFLAIHELSHNLGFKSPLANRLFSIFANVPIGVPYSASFRPYHNLHHKYMGQNGVDTDLPTSLEAVMLSSLLGKAFFATFQLFFYAIRPVCVLQLEFGWLHMVNIAVQVASDLVLVRSLGKSAFLYLLLSSFLAGSLHPLAGHFIAEHYVFDQISQDKSLPETYSYYGPLNILVYNVGLHNEHHDFPYIPWTRLHKLNRIAREFYDPLPKHTSWPMVLVDFILDDSVSLWSRVKRQTKLKRLDPTRAD